MSSFLDTLSDSLLVRNSLFIDGKWIESSDKFSVYDPSTGMVIADVSCSTVDQVHMAVNSASDAFVSWSNETAVRRSQIMMDWCRLILENTDDLARIIVSEVGKTLNGAIGEVKYAASFVQWFAEEAKRVYGDWIPSPQKDRRYLVIKQPLGVCAAITPFNFPAAMMTRKVAPALCTGCTVVVKPAEKAPLSTLALAYLADKAGFPNGVINVVMGDPSKIVDVLCSDDRVAHLSFTGSTAVGKMLMEKSAPTLKKVALELGGNASFIVLSDAVLKNSVDNLVEAKFRFAGQTCIAPNRIYLQDSIYDSFLRMLMERLEAMVVAPGSDPGSEICSMIDEVAVRKIEELIEDACSKGAVVTKGGKRLPHIGPCFFEPTIIENADTSMRIANEEIFGPVVVLYRFHEEEEVIEKSNSTNYGLVNYVCTNDISRFMMFAEKLESGMVIFNCGIYSNPYAPFGGIKSSGLGREGSKYGTDSYLNVKLVCVGDL
ncbi:MULTISPECIES: NAD-dependent succinate-semialdehyde dehydrogenase [Candidatus Ichthyocystis]|uniref:Succinate-semialdehyde dehydrogenase / glutarate-semialdehyde dehydrogenase n=1 Tax=Candidatus Ichthyocystis hellenicum TaxID=1561003 RepID=A0A0S4M281_9BURK|nr:MULTISPECIES: NAD-dependent succinate-semialdehyde dehydrogenase [Ichthyocystis]CUT16994.1 succinate-semialdehyde dehydrogenase / glutarate-semialdehyde dehydrogenase [Candidatus Ichthyocystis hellenicum]